MSIEGKALNPSLISDFLKKLEQIPPFVGEAFDLFAVKKKPDEAGPHQFEVANKQLLNDALTEEKEKKEDSQTEVAPKPDTQKMGNQMGA
jgi:hypothetical protein